MFTVATTTSIAITAGESIVVTVARNSLLE
jgi:hypothetical protein